MSEQEVKELAKLAGIDLENDIIIRDERFYDRIFKDESVGLGETYMVGWWDVRNISLDELFYKICKADLKKQLYELSAYVKFKIISLRLYNSLFPVNTIEESKIVALQHYDLGNDIYEMMLEPMVYSCAYFRNPDDTLLQAQLNKMELIKSKLHLRPGMRVLDIGCGWGELAGYLAKDQIYVDGLTISEEQYNYATDKFSNSYVSFYLRDYREFMPNYRYDAIVSVGMFEHVNSPNYEEFMEIVYLLLKESGLFLLHTIGSNQSSNICDRWINKYIFPNSSLPSLAQISASSEKYFVIEDVHNFGPHYDRTLMCWHNNFTKNFDKINEKRVVPLSDEFYRMWTYYLLSSAGSFRARRIQLYQVVLSKNREETYQAAR